MVVTRLEPTSHSDVCKPYGNRDFMAQSEIITPSNIEVFLNAARQGNVIDSPLLGLNLVSGCDDAHHRTYGLYTLIREHTEACLGQLRMLHGSGLNSRHDAPGDAIRKDLNCHSRERRAWSAVYHANVRYGISVDYIAATAQRSPRAVLCSSTVGLRLLAKDLQYLEGLSGGTAVY